MARPHSHDCTTCKQEFACPGTLWRNHDGFPEVVCSFYHEAGNTECEDCVALERCCWCGMPEGGELGAILTFDGERAHSKCKDEWTSQEAVAVG